MKTGDLLKSEVLGEKDMRTVRGGNAFVLGVIGGMFVTGAADAARENFGMKNLAKQILRESGPKGRAAADRI